MEAIGSIYSAFHRYTTTTNNRHGGKLAVSIAVAHEIRATISTG